VREILERTLEKKQSASLSFLFTWRLDKN